ncbi:Non-ribosomal peptide synthetase [Fusarium irregulare]|uniref:Non-ribosomal peptide synthetase n=1 Tax=Fusarium irregulare TaxID=2494466 RepID=A0A9W8PH10_9HYPO|nr:Non-ribosomal peptide synthetase [Fusarium irregulare]KAJ4006561.1 Non-ribosomal peptide synthetase [Fusarium irregulare]
MTELQSPEKPQAKGVRYDVPVLRKHQEQDSDGLEILLLAWSLLLYRHNHGNHVEFSWGLSEVRSTTCRTFTLNTAKLQWEGSNSVASELEVFRTYLQQQLQSQGPAKTEGCRFFFNDEAAPGDLVNEITEEGDISVNWGNVQIQATLQDDTLWLRPTWREPLGAEFLANHFAQALVEVLNTTLASPNSTIQSVLPLGELDKSVIWNWNKDLPPPVPMCIHTLISEQVRWRPDAQAICSWDGDLTYAEMDKFSTLLAQHLIDLGVKNGDIVPLCFEKSRWTTVGVVGVIKAGAAFVLMDPSQPIQRRQVMAQQVKATHILTSRDQAKYASEIAPETKHVIVDMETIDFLDKTIEDPLRKLPEVPPESLLYIIFTSGSTGTPKGVMLSHETFTASALARSTGIGYSSTSRSLDFTSYAFDVSIDSILCTLIRGGCLCIPTDMDRVNDLSGAIRRLKVNMVNITPSVARILDPDIIPSLNSLGIGGEACSAGDIAIWGQHTRIVIGYGPAECTIGCTVNPSAAGKPYVSIGPGTGACIWLVDPDDHNKLVPVGAVGELLVEGPLVGQGYLGDPAKTNEAFIHDPEFLLAGAGGIPGRRGRLYKTGDLVRYDPDGEKGFIFVGRKDTQIKLRGQRVELGEIEHHIKNLLPSGAEVVAEIIAPRNQSKESMLVAFIADREAKDDGDARPIDYAPRFRDALESLNDKLSKVVPVYMVPTQYIALSKIPYLVSGKIDRKSLRALGAEISANMQASAAANESSEIREPNSEAELFLRDSWCRLLGLESKQVSTTHNFFTSGGDSVLAMKLVPIVRDWGYTLSVADIFNYPVLSDMAKSMQKGDSSKGVDMQIPEFSLLKDGMDRDALCAEAAEHSGCDVSAIEDIYPCAPMQEIHMAFYTRSKENYVAQRIADIPSSSSIEKLKSAWNVVYKESPILRTRIVEFKQHGFMQVVVNESLQWREVDSSLEDFLEVDKKEPMSPGAHLSRFVIVTDKALDKRYFVWTAHHAIYDGWSTDLIVEHARAAYKGERVSRPAQFKHFIRYLAEDSRETSKDYWKTQLSGATGPQFPSLPSRSYIPDPTSLTERFIKLDKAAKSDITIATVIRAAWALLASQYSMSDDVVFGETFMGRTIPLPGAELIEGPILATVPVRIRLDRTTTVQDFLRAVQEQSVARAAHEHLGIQHIRRLSEDAQIACEVTMGLVVQPQDPDPIENESDALPSFRGGDAALEALHFNSYPLMLAVSMQKTGFRLLASFDSDLLSSAQVERVLSQFEVAINQLRGDMARSLNELTCLSDEELGQIWEANKHAPVSPKEISRFLSTGDKYPTAQYVPWVVQPGNERLLMPLGSTGELLLEGVAAGDVADVMDTPEWLKEGAMGYPGRQGKLFRTGDLVKYADDMSLIFVGRKDAMTSVDGRVVDLNATNLELKRLLPNNVEAVSRLVVPKGSSSQTPVVVAFIKETTPKDAQLLKLDVETGDASLPLSQALSVELSTAIIGLNKALVETLPPYAIPSICIPLGDSANIEKLDTAADNVTLSLVVELRKAFASLKKTIADTTVLTTKERVLRASWSKFLGIEEEKLSLDDNFFRLGGDSIVAMRMVSALRQEGYRLSVASIFQNMQLRGMANSLVEVSTESGETGKKYIAFSLLGMKDVGSFLAQTIQPQLADSRWKIQDVLPATGPQTGDVKQSVYAPRSSVQYNMLYFDPSIDTTRLVDSFQYLVSQHAILRTVFVQNEGQTFQVILDDLKVPVTEQNVDGSIDVAAKQLAETDANNSTDLAFGSSFIRLFVLRGEKENAFMIRISHAQYDGVSLPELLRQLELRYRGLEIPSSEPFQTYIQHLSSVKPQNVEYWRKTLQGSSHTEIAPAADPQQKTAFMTRDVDISGASPDTTHAMLLTAGWAKVLSQHLNVSDVTFGGIVSGRDVDVPGIDTIMGPCYQYQPVRVKFEPSLTASQLLDSVRSQSLEGSQRATLSFQEVLKECTGWPAETPFYGSFTNHLNKEFFDSIPFAGTKCRVDYSIPHPEPATPPRVVSFVENGRTQIGIEADEERREFWEARLEELARAVETFIKNPEAPI